MHVALDELGVLGTVEVHEVDMVGFNEQMGRFMLDGTGGKRTRREVKQRFFMPHTVRLQGVQLVRQLQGKSILDMLADVELGNEVLCRVVRADVLVQFLFQERKILFADVDTGGLCVSAELVDAVAAMFERFKDIDAFNTAGAAFEHIAVLDEEQGGTGIFLGDARRNDAHEARAPMLVREHDDVAVSALLTDFCLGAFIQFIATLLPFDVVFV